MPRNTGDCPTASDVARRALILKHIVFNALMISPREVLADSWETWSEDKRRSFTKHAENARDKFWSRLFDAGVGEYLTDSETMIASYTAVTMPQQALVDSSWRMESLIVMMWAIQLVDELPAYDTKADVKLMKLIPQEGVEEFIRSATLRSHREIAQAREVAELWHWRSRTRQLMEEGREFPAYENARFHSYDEAVRGIAELAESKRYIPPQIDNDFPAKGKAYRDLSESEWSGVRSIAKERHYALNWLCGYAPDNCWDQTPTDT